MWNSELFLTLTTNAISKILEMFRYLYFGRYFILRLFFFENVQFLTFQKFGVQKILTFVIDFRTLSIPYIFLKNSECFIILKITQWRSWLRHYATSRKVAGSRTCEVEFFDSPNPSSRTMALVSTQPLSEISTRNLPGGKGRPACKADSLTSISSRLSRKNVGASTSHSPMGLHGLLQG
jgi:hypothetical protein